MKTLILAAIAATLALGNLTALACEKKSTNSSQAEGSIKVLKPKG